ncbi:hypothetical protein RB595_001979 [Gaeumannomyces hyphopodioides]
MAPPKISEGQWLELEPRVKELFRQHVPLKCKDGSRQTVSDILRQETGLAVTISQLEAKLKVWNVAKKLKLSEWKIVMPRLEQLEASGTKYRLLLARQEIKASAILRAKRVLKSKSSGEPHVAASSQSTNELDARQISIMIPGDGGQWVPYRGTEARLVRSLSLSPAFDAGFAIDASPSAPVSTDIVLFPRTGPLETNAYVPRGDSTGMQQWAMPALSGVLGPTACNDQFFRVDSISRQTSPLLGSPPFSPLFMTGQYSSRSPCSRALADHLPDLFQPTQTALRPGFASLSSPLLRRIPSLLHNVLRQAVDLSGDPPAPRPKLLYWPDISYNEGQKLPEVEVLFDRLFALLSHTAAERILNSAAEAMEPEAVVREMFLHSIINNFAGLEDIPLKGMLALLKNDRQMIAELSQRLRESSPALASTIIDNLFRASVKAGDVQTAKLIVKAASGQPYAIDPNVVVCQDEGESHTPLELAVKSHEIEMVSLLIDLGADVNGSYERQHNNYSGPLGFAVSYQSVLNSPGRAGEIVSVLLERGAKVNSEHAEAAFGFPDIDVLVALLERLHDHFEITDQSEILSSLSKVACHSDHQQSTTVFKLLLGLCATSECGECITHFGMAFVLAAASGNLELCRIFLRHECPVTMLTLSGAIRGGNSAIVNLMLDQGIDTNVPLNNQLDPPRWFRHTFVDLNKSHVSLFIFPTTPLAEAIRSRNHRLAGRLEQIGARRQVEESVSHFEAAAIASAEVGDLESLERILDTIPRFRRVDMTTDFHGPHAAPEFPGTYLTLALITAIRNQQAEAIQMLMNAGAREWTYDYDSQLYSALREAIRQRNRLIVYDILEADASLAVPNSHSTVMPPCPITLAVQWGDASLVGDLLQMRTAFKLGPPLAAAISMKRKEMAKLLVDNGADVGFSRPPWNPLANAMELDDDEMVEVLLSGRISTFNLVAFQRSTTADSRYLGALLEAYKAKSPALLFEFGSHLLFHAIKVNNIRALRLFLAAGLDANKFQTGANLSPLGYAAKSAHNLDAIRALIDAGADVNSIAAAPNGVGQTSERAKANAWPRETALLIAIKCGKKDVVALLLDRGADVNRAARLGVKRTPLQAACEGGSWEIVEMLLKNGADVNAAPTRQGGGTALQLAAIGGYIRIVERLLSLGASVHAAPAKLNGRTALQAAAEHGRLDVLGALWAAREGTGFSKDEVQAAIDYASKNGHRGCAGYIWFLSSTQPNGQGLLEVSMADFCL